VAGGADCGGVVCLMAADAAAHGGNACGLGHGIELGDVAVAHGALQAGSDGLHRVSCLFGESRHGAIIRFCPAGKSLLKCLLQIIAGACMAQRCQICGKGPHYGNVISHANNTRRRRWNPNLRRVRALVNGARKRIRVCTACLRSGRVKKAA